MAVKWIKKKLRKTDFCFLLMLGDVVFRTSSRGNKEEGHRGARLAECEKRAKDMNE